MKSNERIRIELKTFYSATVQMKDGRTVERKVLLIGDDPEALLKTVEGECARNGAVLAGFRGPISEWIPWATPEPLPTPIPIPAPDDSPIRCPNCKSAQVARTKEGFGLGKAAMGGLLLGPFGLLGGLLGGGVTITCLKCGNVFLPGQSG